MRISSHITALSPQSTKGSHYTEKKASKTNKSLTINLKEVAITFSQKEDHSKEIGLYDSKGKNTFSESPPQKAKAENVIDAEFEEMLLLEETNKKNEALKAYSGVDRLGEQFKGARLSVYV